MKNKKGVFFSLDALVALGIILLGAIIAYPVIQNYSADSFIQRDVVSTLSSLRIGDINNVLVAELIANGNVSDLNKSVLEQIGEFYIVNRSLARDLTNSIFDNINSSENFGLWFGDSLIASRNSTPYETASDIYVESQIISGIQEGESVTAFSGRAFLERSSRNKYFYFGGHVGEGNISALIEYDGILTSASVELAITKDFDIYVNDVFAGSFSGSASQYVPIEYSIPIDDFVPGENIVEFRGDNLNIDGGFVKIVYDTDDVYTDAKRYYFPGINGAVNLYDGFYVPRTLDEMSIRLHYNNSADSFLNIGNVTVFNRSTVDEETILIDDVALSALLDYDEISEKTVPLRLGLDNASYLVNASLDADVIAVNDLSGSMADSCSGASWWCCWLNNCNSETGCNTCSGTLVPRLTALKEANNLFIDSLLNESDNRVGLVSYASSYLPGYSHALSVDNVSLKNEIATWVAGGGTCICCGINEAANQLVAGSNPGKFRSVVVMSDGGANYECAQQGTGSATQDAIQAACDAYEDYGIKIYSVGFGTGVDEVTLSAIASCGDGSYYYGGVDSLVGVYEEIAQEIIDASFFEQTLAVFGSYTSRLYPDSYIEFEYNDTTYPFGMISTAEKSFVDADYGTFDLPMNSSILETSVISYSGQRWTDDVIVNSIPVYNLDDYGNDYLSLGDPYSVHVPNDRINQSNVINLTTGLAPDNVTGGSASNKIIYTVVQDNVAAYSSLSPVSDGCIWRVEFEDGSELASRAPVDYQGTEYCYYTSGGQNVSSAVGDAMQVSVMRLFELLDFDSDGMLDVKFSSQDLHISSSAISGIPFDWATKMQVRTWR